MTMRVQDLDDRALLEQCPDAWLNSDHTARCGEENGQPRSNECDDFGAGVWSLYGFDRPYCTKHAANRIRSRTFLHAQWHQAPDHQRSDPMTTGLVLLTAAVIVIVVAVGAWSAVGAALAFTSVATVVLQTLGAVTTTGVLGLLLYGIAKLASDREATR